MPNEPEPKLEELSAYLDHELDDGEQARVAKHIAGCADCQARLDGLRQTVYAVRSLPQESPPRSFTIPQSQPRRSFSWAPVGWAGGLAAAMLIVIVGVTQLHFPGGGAATMSSGSGGSNYAAQAPAAAASKGAAGSSAVDQLRSRYFLQPDAGSFPNGSITADPSNANRQLVLGSDAATYSVQGTMRVRIILQGDPSPSIDMQAQGLSVVLVRNGVGVALRDLSGSRAYGGPPVFTGGYAIATLPQPAPGSYTLVATWTIPDGSGRVLQASVPITVSAS